ncbi:alpha/beta fold hydrolase [Granulicella sp. dw_53]|uniref:alpha/beta hydrolase family protein n=1 Tax=Granulicella sp. dw_53 TaxID=2719792 RepID=UPI001BD21FB7|nr:alpha/beta fold hydrolase [Granulicella sp. dw_53]
MPNFVSGGKTIHIQQLEPSGPGPFPAIVLLHGAGGNVSLWFDPIAPYLSRLGIALYAIHYFERTGTTHADDTILRDGHHVPLWLETISDALAYISARPKIDSRRIALLGISLGAFLSLAFASTAKNIRAIVEISGGLVPPYAAKATSSFPPTLILHGEADTVVPVAQAHALNTFLNQLGTPHQLQLFPAEGHWFSPGARLRIFASIAQFLGRYL